MANELEQLHLPDLLTRLAVDPQQGLNDQQVEERLEESGPNSLAPQQRRSSYLGSLLAVAARPASYLLLLIVILHGFPGSVDRVDVAFAGIALALWWIDLSGLYAANRGVEELAASCDVPPSVLTRRNGRDVVLPADELVRGDIIHLRKGQRVPADCRLLSDVHCEVDEQALTGTAGAAFKAPHEAPAQPTRHTDQPVNDVLLKGTRMISGCGTFIVVATGMSTRIARISGRKRQPADQPTQLQSIVANEMIYTTLITAVLCLGVFGIGMQRGISWWSSMLSALTLFFVLCPRSTITNLRQLQVTGARRIARTGVMLRNLAAAETLGSVTALVTKKRNLLAPNCTYVNAVIVLSGSSEGNNSRHKHDVIRPHIIDDPAHAPAGLLVPLLSAWSLTTHISDKHELATLLSSEDQLREGGDPPNVTAHHDEYDQSVQRVLNAMAGSAGPQCVAHTLSSHLKIVGEYVFEAQSGVSAKLRKRRPSDGSSPAVRIVVSRGAPEVVLQRCTTALVAMRNPRTGEEDPHADHLLDQFDITEAVLNGERLLPLDDVMRTDIYDTVHRKAAADGSQLLAYSVHVVKAGHGGTPKTRDDWADLVSDGVFVGCMSFQTSDHKAAAGAIAERAGIMRGYSGTDHAYTVMDGSVLLTGAMVREAAETINVFSRATPAHTLQIVRALQQQGHVVAYLGDGNDDGAVLNTANLGVILHRDEEVDWDLTQASVIVRQSERMLLGLARSFVEGRRINANVRKLLTLQAACKVTLMTLGIFTVAAHRAFVFTPLQLLFIDLLLSGGAVAVFANEAREHGPATALPDGTSHTSVFARIGSAIASASGVLIVVVYTAYLFGWYLISPARAARDPEAKAAMGTTMAFLTWLMAQVTLTMALRTRYQPLRSHGFFTNTSVWTWASLVALLVGLIGQFESVQRLLGLLPLPGSAWLACLCLSVVCLCIDVGKEVDTVGIGRRHADPGTQESDEETMPLLR
ncbi:hypothetical protein RI367_002124 [Sorochytrium milnesiophthora]